MSNALNIAKFCADGGEVGLRKTSGRALKAFGAAGAGDFTAGTTPQPA